MKFDVREWIAVVLILVVVLGGGVLVLARRGSGPEEVRATLDLAGAMGGTDTAGYARALTPRPFVFPADHGPHPGFRTEWWYVTTNLEDETGRRFGVQFTLFRSALAPEPAGAGDAGRDTVGPTGSTTSPGPTGSTGSTPPTGPTERTSAWATRQVHMGHLAVTDVEGGAFHEAERFSRVARGLAGGTADPLRIWLDGWSLTGGGERSPVDPAAGPVFPLRVQAREGDVAVDLALTPAKPHVLQGDRGLSQKGPEPGNASFYYSFTRLEARGTVEVDGRTHDVRGLAWLDREWSTSALSAGQEGWDWFALHLSDGRDLMVYRLRGPGDTTDPLSEGIVVAADGAARRLARDDFRVTPTGEWASPLDGTVYPSGWEVEVPSEGLALRVTPVRRDQELNVTVRYWEGAVDVTELAGDGAAGRGGGASREETDRSPGPISGRGYVELTGYASPVEGRTPGAGAR
ncbi:MAG TPA: lipocalin-like domain-containing protein [Longimicrobiales bacterium]|nr:lipocalin-like domain-containing protein [Longimicrobiales bacterium]